MKWIIAEGPDKNWIHVTVDLINYCINTKKAEIHFEGSDPSDFCMLLNNDSHIRNLVDRACIVHRESSGEWAEDRPDSWSIHYGNKVVRIDWKGELVKGSSKKEASSLTPEAQEWISSKIEKLRGEGKDEGQASAIAYSMAREKGFDVPEPKKAGISAEVKTEMEDTASVQRTAIDIEQMAREKYNKQLHELTDEEIRGLMTSLQEQPPVQTISPGQPQVAPLIPGQASVGIRWMVTAGDNPFMDDDSDDDDGEEDMDEEKDKKDKPSGEKKDEKKPAPKSKGDGKESPKEHKEEGASAKKALDSLKKLLDKEGDEPAQHKDLLEQAIGLLEEFIGEEKGEHPIDGIPAKVDLEIVKPTMDMSPMPSMPPMGGPKPMPGMAPAHSSWTQEPISGFSMHDRVWHKAIADAMESVGVEPGRVIAFSDNRIVVDWGDDIPTEENATDLVMAQAANGESDLFSGQDAEPTDSEPVVEQTVDTRAEIEQIMSATSIKDLMSRNRQSSTSSKAIIHVGTGTEGEFVAKAADGRYLINIGGEEIFVYPYEVQFVNQTQGE